MEKGTLYFSSSPSSRPASSNNDLPASCSFGRPRGRWLDPKPNSWAVLVIHGKAPYGRPRYMLFRSRFTSPSVCPFVHVLQPFLWASDRPRVYLRPATFLNRCQARPTPILGSRDNRPVSSKSVRHADISEEDKRASSEKVKCPLFLPTLHYQLSTLCHPRSFRLRLNHAAVPHDLTLRQRPWRSSRWDRKILLASRTPSGAG